MNLRGTKLESQNDNIHAFMNKKSKNLLFKNSEMAKGGAFIFISFEKAHQLYRSTGVFKEDFPALFGIAFFRLSKRKGKMEGILQLLIFNKKSAEPCTFGPIWHFFPHIFNFKMQ